jgi:hypothetical protein
VTAKLSASVAGTMWTSVESLFDEPPEEFRIWNRADIEPHTNRGRAYVPRAERNANPAAVNRLKTHCPYGHPYTPENTYTRPGTKSRECITCRHIRRRERRENGC